MRSAAWTPVHGQPESDSKDENISICPLSSSLTGLTKPAQQTTFDGSLYDNFHLIIEHQTSAFSKSAEDSNYAISIPSDV